MRRIRVDTPSKGYDIILGTGLLANVGETVKSVTGGRAAVITDTNVDALWSEKVMASLEKSGIKTVKFVFPAGEKSKNAGTLLNILNFLAENRFSRTDTVIALGGGVAGDTAGLAAALYMRGIGLIQIPTTLLSMVDSSVGGKTAVDLPEGKNLMGAFYQPDMVICDTDTLTTLPEREMRCGYGEIVKYAMTFDASLAVDVLSGMDMTETVTRCVELKRRAAASDERDTGERRLLNFGHTFGHAIEHLSGYTMSHGEAVAVGMVIITRACVKKGICGRETLDELLAMLGAFGLPTETDIAPEKIAETALMDKKRSGDVMTLALVRSVGSGFLAEMKTDEVRTMLRIGMEE